jgi:CHAT domain-containing protein/cytochrome c-type biogenesis protein CcmH/NrfG
LTRPFDKHLDSDELHCLVTLQGSSVPSSEPLSEKNLGEARRHVESCHSCSRRLQMHRIVQSEILRMRPLKPLSPTPECLGDGEWLEVAAGLYSDVKTRELMKHAAQCGRCGPLLKNAAETMADETTPSEETLLNSLSSARPEWQRNMAATLRAGAGPQDDSREKKEGVQWWQALFSWPRPVFALAGVAAAVLAGWLGLRMLQPPSTDQLLARAYTEHRTLEVRIPGAKYAPMRVERAASGSNLDKSPSLLKAEAVIGENLRKNPDDPTWLQAKARADLLDGNYDSAIKSLQRALETQPESPSLLTDLGSAYFLRAESANLAIDYGNAIESLGKALAKSPDDPVALFNRALACERMFLYTQAVDDWEHYLRVDPRGAWAAEVRQRLSAVKQELEEHDRSAAEPLLGPSEIAKASASDAALSTQIDGRIEEYLRVAVVEWLPRAYPVGAGENANVADLRSTLRIVAELTSQKHGDQWLEDVLSTPQSQYFASAVGALSSAIKANDIGDNMAARRHASEAERWFASSANEAGALRARVEHLFATKDAQEGKACLESSQRLEGRFQDHSYLWLKTQFHLEQGTCFWFMGNLADARKSYENAERDAQAAGYPSIFLRTQDHLSGLYAESGDFAASANRVQSALGRFWSGRYPAVRGYNLYYNIYEASRLTNRPHLQLAAWRDGLALSESFGDTLMRAMAHSAMADAAVTAGLPQVAEQEFTKAEQFFAVSPQIQSTKIARVEAETRLAEVETSQGKERQAASRLRRFAPQVSNLSDTFLEILFYTTMGDAEARIGNAREAGFALESAVALAELQLQSLHNDKSRIDWEARTSNSYRDLAQLRLLQGNAQGALEIWELYQGAATRAGRARTPQLLRSAKSLLEPNEITMRLPTLVKETVVSYAVFPQGLAVWVYDNRGVFTHWFEGNAGDIEAKVERFRSLCSVPDSNLSDLQRNARALYDLFVAPIEQHLSPDRVLVIELDDRLVGLPFDALIDTQGHYLSERGRLFLSLGIYYRRDARALAPITVDSPALVAAVPVSYVFRNLSFTPLPDAASEGEMVASHFRSAQLLSDRNATAAAVASGLPTASLFHFSGHSLSTEQQSGLLLSDALLSAASLRKVSLSRMQLVVLSACNTQDASAGGGVFSSDSLLRVFLQRGVPNVVASRWNVDSVATRQFMQLFYQALLSGGNPSDAIHQAQFGLRSRPEMAHPYYWSAFSVFSLV